MDRAIWKNIFCDEDVGRVTLRRDYRVSEMKSVFIGKEDGKNLERTLVSIYGSFVEITV